MLSSIELWLAGVLAGVWNVLNEKFISVKRSICVFILGVTFCVAPAIILEKLGYDAGLSTCVGYFCGILSQKIYNAMSKLIEKTPEIIAKRIVNNDNDGGENETGRDH